jgi:hypothetical protein
LETKIITYEKHESQTFVAYKFSFFFKSFGRVEEHEVLGEERLRHLPSRGSVPESHGRQPGSPGVAEPLYVSGHPGKNQRHPKRYFDPC